jgi:hypothetical protein
MMVLSFGAILYQHLLPPFIVSWPVVLAAEVAALEVVQRRTISTTRICNSSQTTRITM